MSKALPTKTRCFECMHYSTCRFPYEQAIDCTFFEPAMPNDCKTLLTLCEWCKKDIKIDDWADRLVAFKKTQFSTHHNRAPRYLCEECFDRVSAHSSTFWYRYICGESLVDDNPVNSVDNSFRIERAPFASAHKTETELLRELRALTLKYNSKKNAIVKYNKVI